MGFQEVAFQPSRASFLTTFLKNCGKGVGTITYPKAIVRVSKGIQPEKFLCSNKASFVSCEFCADYKAVTKMT